MSKIAGVAHAMLSHLMKNRHRLPRFVNSLMDTVARNPDGFASRTASFLLGGSSASNVPPPTAVPDADVRVYIGATNYSGQGYLWARSLEAKSRGLGARNMAVELPGGFSFAADSLVPVGVYNTSRTWQEAELASVQKFTHVLFEAERPLFGTLFDRDVAREIRALQAEGVSCAFLCHGTDVRSPLRHMSENRWSPFSPDTEQTRRLQSDVESNLALLRAHHLPILVSTPDLLFDVPEASWCPVVVKAESWAASGRLFAGSKPVVVHIPSMGPVKGTELIEPSLRKLHSEGVIEYRSASGIRSDQMPALIGDADIVLDQFRIGSYGVAAVEAMAAGRVVVGHVLPSVRSLVLAQTGRDLPIVEADPESIEAVLRHVTTDRGQSRAVAEQGEEFVDAVHSGEKSATVLLENWIRAAEPYG